MRLDCVLVACNDNPHYLSFWPLVKKAWWDIAELPCVLVYVGETLPPELASDPAVKHFKPIPGWPTATQAQCIRLLYPALLKCEGAVMVSDMDMIPMQKDWFVDRFAMFQPTQFVSLRGIDEGEKQIYMCYVGAIPTVWGDLFQIGSEADIRQQLADWSIQYTANGRHGGTGWCTDQLELYRRVKALPKERIGLIPWTPTISRLDRGRPYDWLHWDEETQKRIRKEPYVDFHMPPMEPFGPRIEEILELRTQALASSCIRDGYVPF
jgi:hypothetical protein